MAQLTLVSGWEMNHLDRSICPQLIGIFTIIGKHPSHHYLQNPYRFIGILTIIVNDPYQLIGILTIIVTNPYKLIGILTIIVTIMFINT